MTREKTEEICYSCPEPGTGFGVVRLHRPKVNMGERRRVRGWGGCEIDAPREVWVGRLRRIFLPPIWRWATYRNHFVYVKLACSLKKLSHIGNADDVGKSPAEKTFILQSM